MNITAKTAAMDYVRELREANERCAHRLAYLDSRRALDVVAALSGNLVEIRWLEKEHGVRDSVDRWWSRR